MKSETGFNPLVSIIVPAYNVERYIEHCMETLLNQTYKNIEIILVDDGSTDKTPQMCDEYAAKDSRVQSFHQKNSGQAAARNFALPKTKGEYILYVDSDDYVAFDHVERMVRVVEAYDADIVHCYGQKFWDGDVENNKEISSEPLKVKVYGTTEAMEDLCYQRTFSMSPWVKLIRRDIIEQFPFPVGKGYEDMAIVYKLVGAAQRNVVLPEVLYFYRQHRASTMHTSFSDKKVDRIRIAEELKNYVETNFPENTQAVKTRYIFANLQLLMDLPFDKKYNELRDTVKRNIKSVRKDVIKDSKSKKTIRFMATCSYLGIGVLMLLGRVYKRIFV